MDVLRKNYARITKDLEPDQVLNFLYQEKVIDAVVRDTVRAGTTRQKRAELLVDCVERRGSKGTEVFIKGLRKSSQKHLAEILSGKSSVVTEVDSDHEERSAVSRQDTSQADGSLLLIRNNQVDIKHLSKTIVKRKPLQEVSEDSTSPMNQFYRQRKGNFAKENKEQDENN